MNSPNPDNDYFGSDLEDMSRAVNYMHWVLDAFSPYMGRTIVEVGAGMGSFSRVVIENRNPDVYIACEPARNMYSLLEANLQSLKNAFPVRGFLKDTVSLAPYPPDTILYVNVLEHILHDRIELTLAYESLAQGGHVCILVPALQFLYSRFDEMVGHHRRYNKKELIASVEWAGFKTLKCYYIDFLGVISWWIVFRLLKQVKLRADRVLFYDRMIIPLMRRMLGKENRLIGKNLILIGRKV